MKLSKLFDVEICKNPISIETAELNPGNTAYITTTSYNNGIECFVDFPSQYSGGVITVSKDGGNGDAFYQKYPFCGNEKVMVLTPKKQMTENELLFYTYVINCNKYKFAYGRKCSLERLRNLEIVEQSRIEQWVFESNTNKIESNNKNIEQIRDIKTWKFFNFSTLFDIRKGYYNKKPEHCIDGNIPFLGATEKNNGVTEYYSLEDISFASISKEETIPNLDNKIFPENAITITNDGSVGFAFYQNKRFTCSHSVTPLYLKNHVLNKYLALFISTIICKDRYRWAYGRKWRPERMQKSKLLLPIKLNPDNTPCIDKACIFSKEGYIPDWEYMENYIKSLPYGDRI